VYYVIVLALYMTSSYREVLRCLIEDIQRVGGPSATVKVTGKSRGSLRRAPGWAGSRSSICTTRSCAPMP
jgi:hypothetical protein